MEHDPLDLGFPPLPERHTTFEHSLALGSDCLTSWNALYGFDALHHDSGFTNIEEPGRSGYSLVDEAPSASRWTILLSAPNPVPLRGTTSYAGRTLSNFYDGQASVSWHDSLTNRAHHQKVEVHVSMSPIVGELGRNVPLLGLHFDEGPVYRDSPRTPARRVMVNAVTTPDHKSGRWSVEAQASDSEGEEVEDTMDEDEGIEDDCECESDEEEEEEEEEDMVQYEEEEEETGDEEDDAQIVVDAPGSISASATSFPTSTRFHEQLRGDDENPFEGSSPITVYTNPLHYAVHNITSAGVTLSEDALRREVVLPGQPRDAAEAPQPIPDFTPPPQPIYNLQADASPSPVSEEPLSPPRTPQSPLEPNGLLSAFREVVYPRPGTPHPFTNRGREAMRRMHSDIPPLAADPLDTLPAPLLVYTATLAASGAPNPSAEPSTPARKSASPQANEDSPPYVPQTPIGPYLPSPEAVGWAYEEDEERQPSKVPCSLDLAPCLRLPTTQSPAAASPAKATSAAGSTAGTPPPAYAGGIRISTRLLNEIRGSYGQDRVPFPLQRHSRLRALTVADVREIAIYCTLFNISGWLEVTHQRLHLDASEDSRQQHDRLFVLSSEWGGNPLLHPIEQLFLRQAAYFLDHCLEFDRENTWEHDHVRDNITRISHFRVNGADSFTIASQRILGFYGPPLGIYGPNNEHAFFEGENACAMDHDTDGDDDGN